MWERVTDWFRSVGVTISLNWRKMKTLGLKHILNERRLPSKPRQTTSAVIMPFDEEIRYKPWVVIKETGQIGVVDHVKSDGRLGIRPVDPVTAAYVPNMSRHWSWEDRIRIPHELALLPGKVRQATKDEIPDIVK